MRPNPEHTLDEFVTLVAIALAVALVIALLNGYETKQNTDQDRGGVWNIERRSPSPRGP